MYFQQDALQQEIMKREALQQEADNLKARLRLEQQHWEAERRKKVQEVAELTKQLEEGRGHSFSKRETHTEAPKTHKEVSPGRYLRPRRMFTLPLIQSFFFTNFFHRIRSPRLTLKDSPTLAVPVTSTQSCNASSTSLNSDTTSKRNSTSMIELHIVRHI